MAPRRQFEYVRPSRDEIERDLQRRASQRGGEYEGVFVDSVQIYKPRQGENVVRLLHGTWAEGVGFGFPIYVHYGVGPAGQGATVLCPASHNKGRCPVCEARVRLEAIGADEKEIRDHRTVKRVAAWLIDRKDEAKGVQMWAMPYTLDKDIAQHSKDPSSGDMFVIDDPDEGYDVIFTREGEKDRTKYTGVQLSRRSSRIDDDAYDFVTDHPIPEMLIWRDYVQILALYEGVTEEEAEELAKQREERRNAERGEGRGGRGATREEEPRRRRTRDPEPEPEPARRGRSRDPEPEPEEPPRRGRARDPEPEPEPARRGRSRDPEPEPEPRRSRSNGDARDRINDEIPWNRLDRGRGEDREEGASRTRRTLRAEAPEEPEERRAPATREPDTGGVGSRLRARYQR